jgi:hypothetical protein
MDDVTIKVQFLSLVVGVLLPLVVGFVTKRTTDPGVKASLLAFLSAVSGFGTEALNSWGHFDWRTAFFTWLATFLTAVGTYYGFFKPTGVAAIAQNSGVK